MHTETTRRSGYWLGAVLLWYYDTSRRACAPELHTMSHVVCACCELDVDADSNKCSRQESLHWPQHAHVRAAKRIPLREAPSSIRVLVTPSYPHQRGEIDRKSGHYHYK
jgi:hypothetical protein